MPYFAVLSETCGFATIGTFADRDEALKHVLDDYEFPEDPNLQVIECPTDKARDLIAEMEALNKEAADLAEAERIANLGATIAAGIEATIKQSLVIQPNLKQSMTPSCGAGKSASSKGPQRKAAADKHPTTIFTPHDPMDRKNKFVRNVKVIRDRK